ncbi:MAG: DEAD/DEAH box helicase family protein, partial [[Clostridium] fimetarium]|nr:DEAD/DEAH box helicase family protein [[Clostridium] fimetarium]
VKAEVAAEARAALTAELLAQMNGTIKAEPGDIVPVSTGGQVVEAEVRANNGANVTVALPDGSEASFPLREIQALSDRARMAAFRAEMEEGTPREAESADAPADLAAGDALAFPDDIDGPLAGAEARIAEVDRSDPSAPRYVVEYETPDGSTRVANMTAEELAAANAAKKSADEALTPPAESVSSRVENNDDDGNRPQQDNDEPAFISGNDGGSMATDPARGVATNRDRGHIRVYEEGLGSSRNAHINDSERDRRDAESERLVGVAKTNGEYFDKERKAALGDKVSKRSGESDVYDNHNTDGKVYKVKDPYAKSPMKPGVAPEDAVYEHLVHNKYFPETAYGFEGVSDEYGDLRLVLSQDYVKSSRQATKEEVEAALAERGLLPEGGYRYGNDEISVTDVTGDNAIVGADGKVYFIDPVIDFKKPAAEILGPAEGHIPEAGEMVPAPTENAVSGSETAPETDSSVENAREASAAEADAMPMVEVKGKRGEAPALVPDFLAVSPARGRRHLYEERGYSESVADAFVAKTIEKARKDLSKLAGTEPEIGTDLAEYDRAKARWDADVKDARRTLDYWEEVRREQLRVSAERDMAEVAAAQEAEAARRRELAEEAARHREEEARASEDRAARPAQYRRLMDAWDAPASLREHIARYLLSGVRLRWVDKGSTRGLGHHLFGGKSAGRNTRNEYGKFMWLVDDRAGISPEAAAEEIAQAYYGDYENDTDHYSEVFAALLDMLVSQKGPAGMWATALEERRANTGSGLDMFGFTPQEREQYFPGMDDAEVQAALDFYDRFGVTREEYAEYAASHHAAAELIMMADSEYEGFLRNLAGEIADEYDRRKKQQQNLTGGTAPENGGGGALLPGQRADDRGRGAETRQGEPPVAGADGAGSEGLRGTEAQAQANSVAGTGNRAVDEWFGPVYTGFEGRPVEAEEHLRDKCDGIAKGALTYPGLSPIDLAWGDMKAGYMKIVIKHPEVVGKLQSILDSCEIIEQSDNRVVLESDTHKVIVSKMKGATPTDNWLLTAYEKKKKPVSASSSDIETEPGGKRNGTATPQNEAFSLEASDRPAVGDGKGTDTTEVNSGHTGGATVPAGNSSETSDGKVNASPTEKQIGSGESSAQNIGNKRGYAEKVAVAEAQTDTDPTEAQKEAGNYRKGHVTICDFDITIEQPRGSVRRGPVDPATGKPAWETKMANAYGYIRGTESADGDHIDVFLHEDMDRWDGRGVFVVDQTNPDGSFDEHKVMLGFNDDYDAMRAYLANYDADWQRTHPGIRISEVSVEDFRKWVDSGHRKTKPFADYSIAAKGETFEVETPTTVEKAPNRGYAIVAKPYTNKNKETLDTYLVTFDRELSKEEKRAMAAAARADFNKGWYDKETGGFMLRGKEDAEAFAKKFSDADGGNKRESGNNANFADVKPWAEMDGSEREAAASKSPLTRDEIESADIDDIIKANALAYLDGRRGTIQTLSYLQAYGHVRNTDGNSGGNSVDADQAQLAGADTGAAGQRGKGDRGGGRPERMDREDGGGALPGAPAGRADSAGDGGAAAGERGGNGVPAEKSAVAGVSAGNLPAGGSGLAGGVGSDGRAGGREGGGDVAGASAGWDTASRPAAGGEADVAVDTAKADPLGSAIADFKDILGEFARAGRGEMSLSVAGMNARQMEMLPRVIAAGARVGYELIKKGLTTLAAWSSAMRTHIGGPLRASGLTDTEVDGWITEMWDCDYTADGVTRRISEWASILSREELRSKARATLEDKRAAQAAAEDIPVRVADADNIRDTLPFLLPQQRQDVLLAETQFFDPSHADEAHAYGKGFMFTNGTGTGKTYTGLGIVKRFVKQGKGRVLILTPSQTKVSDWIKDGENLGLAIRDLDSWARERGTTATTENGDGVIITTYANFRQNKALEEGCFDLVVYDESHRILENKKGIATNGLSAHYRLSNKDEGHAFARLRDTNPVYREMLKTREDYDDLYAKTVNNAKSATGIDNMFTLIVNGHIPPAGADEWTPAAEEKFPELSALRKRERELRAKFDADVRPALEEQARADAARTKVVFLSATPFNTRENIDYAEGYIFSYPSDEGGNYMSPRGRSRFFLDHFGAGYKWRYHRLESSTENAQALARQEVEFSDWLRNDLRTMSGRVIDSEYDYSRDFPTVTGEYAARFNEATSELALNEHTRDAYRETIGDYNYGGALFESMKVSQVIPRIRAHIAAGRKVAVFHRRVETKEPLAPPFATLFARAAAMARDISDQAKSKEAAAEVRRLRRRYADLLEWERTLDLRMPREQLADAFGRDAIAFFSGRESQREKSRAVEDFNADEGGKDIIVIQEASGKEGISLHDRTGRHQRVIMTLGLPQSPITALQIEGRIFRIGNRSNAVFEYPLLGLDSEMVLFGQKFNAQVGTTENLALGSLARDLRESFARGIETRSGEVDIERQGVGGKEMDASSGSSDVSPFERAVLDYYTNHKISSSRDNREGKDYYPTPEPLGYMMSVWAGLSEGESVLEPSAGHGAIARYVPASNVLTAIEPSATLFSRLQIKAGGVGRKFENGVFEDYNIVNKHDAILMNPPFGSGGRLAIDHLAKAFGHLEEGGRIVAVIPRGSADSKFERWYSGEKSAVLTGEVNLPDITFERAGTSVRCRVVVIDKVGDRELAARAGASARHIDLSGRNYAKIEEFFDEISGIEMPPRTIDTLARLRKKALPVARSVRTIKGVTDVQVGSDNIRVKGRGVWETLNWNYPSAEALETGMREKHAEYTRWEGNAERRGNEAEAEVYRELKRLCARLAGKTEEEMERGSGATSASEPSGRYRHRSRKGAFNMMASLFDSEEAPAENAEAYAAANAAIEEYATAYDEYLRRAESEVEEAGSDPLAGEEFDYAHARALEALAA